MTRQRRQFDASFKLEWINRVIVWIGPNYMRAKPLAQVANSRNGSAGSKLNDNYSFDTQ